MTRRQTLALGFGAIAAVGAGAQRFVSRSGNVDLRLKARRRGREPDAARVVEDELVWQAAKTAIIICDMWNDHYCFNAVTRLEAMIPHMNRVIAGARAQGVKIIHAPSTTMEFYAGTSQRQRMLDAPQAEPPVPIAKWCYLDPKSEAALPIEDGDVPCDDLVGRERKPMYHRQHADLDISEEDGISDDGQEIFNYFEQTGVSNVALMGVHINKCVLGRPFGIRQQVRLGKNVVLARDLTDSMYDPRDPPFVSHDRGTELVIEHVERHWCPTVLGVDLAGAGELS